MKYILAEIDANSGRLAISGMGFAVEKDLKKNDFLIASRGALLYRDKGFFEKSVAYHFEPAIRIDDIDFRLSVYFIDGGGASEKCTGYVLNPFEYGGEDNDVGLMNLFVPFLTKKLLKPPLAEEGVLEWKMPWGRAYIYIEIKDQHPTMPKIAIDWKM